MYKEMTDGVLDGLLYAAFQNNWKEIDGYPSDEELAKMYPVPEGGAKRYVKIYKRMERKKRLTPWVIVKRVAVTFLVIVSAVFAILMTNDNVRASVFESIAKWFDGHVEIDYNNAQAPANDEKKSIYDFEIGYIPEGFVLYEKREDDTSRVYRYMLENNNSVLISIKLSYSEGRSLSLDTDHSENEHTMINGLDTYIAYDHKENAGTVVMGNKKITIKVFAVLDYEELIKIAENIKEDRGRFYVLPRRRRTAFRYTEFSYISSNGQNSSL